MPIRLGLLDPALNSARMWGVARWGPGIGAMLAASALRHPCRPAIIDDGGTITYADLDRLATRLAAVFRNWKADGAVGILCRNHRGFVIAQVAAERAGRDVVLLSTALPASGLATIVEREHLAVVVADTEFQPLITSIGLEVVDPASNGRSTADGRPGVLVADGPAAAAWAKLRARSWVAPPTRRSRLVMLTSGTTGTPKGAERANRPPGPEGLSMLREIPYGVGDLYYVAPPLFHAWGLSQLTLAIGFASTVILRRRFDAEATVELLAERRLDVLAVVPLMLRRVLKAVEALGSDAPAMNAPRITACSGNVLSGDLSWEWMDRFGDRLYNFYGSTETGIGTVARPVDMRRSPGTVGRPPRGVNLAILDPEGMPLPPGELGAIHLSSRMQFEGYTDGSDRVRNGSLMATNDLGYLDDKGLLHVDGRAGDMIVTGGENVFPSAVEEVIDRQPGVELSAVVGQEDVEFGQRVVAYVVPLDGAELDLGLLGAAVARELPGFMVPREFHQVEALPMTTTGKVIRRQLAVLGRADRL